MSKWAELLQKGTNYFLNPRVALLLSGLLLILAFWLPIWGFSIYAPQYPEGLHMQIYADRITGDVQNINTLNHYVGMKHIEPEKMIEFKWAPRLILFLAVAALGLSLFKNGKRSYLSWFSALLVLMIVGLTDFYQWEYLYGHELNPEAAIKIPGMFFQPPMIGSKQMLNITSYSYPEVAGWIFFLVLGLGLAYVAKILFRKKIETFFASSIAVLMLAVLGGCSPKLQPEPIQLEKDHCSVCKMTISDSRFGGEIVLKTGKVLKVDSLDCLINQMHQSGNDVHGVYTVDFFDSEKFIDVHHAFFTKLIGIRGPMGEAKIASATREKLDKVRVQTWDEVVRFQAVAQ